MENQHEINAVLYSGEKIIKIACSYKTGLWEKYKQAVASLF